MLVESIQEAIKRLTRRNKMKYKVGDKVKIKEKLKDGEKYGGCYFGGSMLQYRGQEAEITLVDTGDYTQTYRINLDNSGYWWNEAMFTEVKKNKKAEEIKIDFSSSVEKLIEAQKKQNEKTNSTLENALESIEVRLAKVMESMVSAVDKKNIMDETIVDEVLNKIKQIPIDDFNKSLEDKIEQFVHEKYGSLPTKIEITNNGKIKELQGIFHKKFNEILKIVQKGVPLMLTGPAGAGKNHTLEQVAEALGLDFYFTNAVTQEFKLTGFIDANGVYQETQFYKAFKNGGLFFLDEVDASCPEALIILNAAIANGYFDFPNGKVEVNPNFRVACAGNTYGTGADMVYVGRNVLDGATLDRFATIEFNYDENIEKQLSYDDELYEFIKTLRRVINETSLRYIVSMRATINATKLLEIGMEKREILKSVILKNMQIDDLNVIVKKMKESNHSEWTSLLGEFANGRN